MRLATVVPLPTDAQLAEAGFVHAEPFMAALESGDDSHFQAFAHEQSCEWGDTPGGGSAPSGDLGGGKAESGEEIESGAFRQLS